MYISPAHNEKSHQKLFHHKVNKPYFHLISFQTDNLTHIHVYLNTIQKDSYRNL